MLIFRYLMPFQQLWSVEHRVFIYTFIETSRYVVPTHNDQTEYHYGVGEQISNNPQDIERAQQAVENCLRLSAVRHARAFIISERNENDDSAIRD